MEEIKVVQIGVGPLGKQIANFIAERPGIRTVAAVDKQRHLIGMDILQSYGGNPSGVTISEHLKDAIQDKEVDVAILSTVSDMARIADQIEEIVKLGIPVISTCEELFFPWGRAPELTKRIDDAAKANGVAVLATGVNPGFLMDTLPSFLTTLCQRVDSIEVNRFQDAQHRRIPFQRKIGAGLTISEFEQQNESGKLSHIGLTESLQFIANQMGWELDHIEETINPVIAEEDINSSAMKISKGQVTGVSQIGRAYSNDVLKITLIFQATIAEPESYDEIFIKGEPNLNFKVQGGVNGDIATSATIINSIPSLLKADPGLKSMGDIIVPSFFSGATKR